MLLATSALLFSNIGDLKLQSGQTLEDARIGYRTFGKMNAAKSNVVLFPSWFNGTTADLVRFICETGPECLVDSGKYFVVAVDALSNGVSSSPSNSPTQKNMAFPRIAIADMVESQRILLRKEFGIEKFKAVVGVSMGGMQTFQWMVSYPQAFELAVPIVGTPKMSSKDILLWSTFLEKFRRGGLGKKKTFSLFDLLRPPAIAGQRDQIQDAFDLGAAPPNAPVNMLDAAAAASLAKKNPMDVLKQFEAMVAHDISKEFERDWNKTAAAVKVKALVIVATQDKAVSPDTPLDFAKRKNWGTFSMPGDCGHKAYDCEKTSISPLIADFLASLP